jgi:hypothetical protein
MTEKQPEYNYHNESELYQRLYKSGACITMTNYLDPEKHKYTSVIGDFNGQVKGQQFFSVKVYKKSLKGKDIKKYVTEYVQRLADKKKIPVDGNWGFCETDENIYFCGSFKQ